MTRRTEQLQELEFLTRLHRRLLGQQPVEDDLELDIALALVNVASIIVVLLDQRRRVRYVNRHFEEISGYTLAELDGRDWFEACIPERERGGLTSLWQQAIGGITTQGNVNAIVLKDGTERYVEWFDRAIMDDQGAPAGVLAVGVDVTEREYAIHGLKEVNEDLEQRVADRTEQLHAQAQLLEGGWNASTVGLAYLDREMRFVRVNEVYASYDDKRPEDFPGKGHFELYPYADNEKIFYEVRDSGEAHSVVAKAFEYDQTPERGVTHWDWTLTPVKALNGEVIGLVLALRDVSERVRAIERLRASQQRIHRQLKEKGVLLQEIQHRVKNNLEVVSSLLYLQASQQDDESIARLFEESRARVQAMSFVHETLYASEDMSSVAFAPYLKRLCSALASAYAHPDCSIDIAIDVDAPNLPVEAAMPCGLVASELMTNAFKYAFNDREEGALRVSLRVEEPDYLLTVSDDGPGLREEDATGNTLGFSLVRMLAEQLGGTLELTSSPFQVTIRFPSPPASLD